MPKQLLIAFLLFNAYAFSQVNGNITDVDGKPLAFVNIYVENTYNGTTTNDSGYYELPLTETGTYTIVYKYLGFKTDKKTVNITAFPHKIDVVLKEDALALEEVTISTKENPAHRIIKAAIAHRKENFEKTDDFTADFYSRGIFRIKNAPEKIMGFDLGDLGGGLDSTRSGVVYLSETISEIAKNGNDFKEKILASKVSGNDNGFSFNMASEVNFNLYKNLVELGDNIVSPIANYAFNYYKYTLLNSYYEDGFLINKIRVEPKKPTDNAFSGDIYIVEDSWEIFAADLSVTGIQIQMPMVKKFVLKQNYSHSAKDNVWALFSQSIDFKFGLFGVNVDGRFTAVYKNYEFNPDFGENAFTNEILKIVKNANKKDSTFWKIQRPIPLTTEESKDYQLKDSIKEIRESKPYLDSLDRKANKFSPTNILMGYSYRNSHKDYNIFIGSPLFNAMYNTVQGWRTNLDITFYKNYKAQHRRFWLSSKIDYGLTDEQFRVSGRFTYQFNDISKPFLTLEGGREIKQFNASEPISPLLNAVTSLFFEKNYAKFYDKSYINVNAGQEIVNGVRLNAGISYQDRKPLFNRSDFVILNRDDVVYSSNNPLAPNDYTEPAFEKNSIFKAYVGAQVKFKQEYISLPDEKFNTFSNKYPVVNLGYTNGFGASDKKFNYQLAEVAVDQNITLGNKGIFSYRAKAGTFLSKDELSFTDFKHFNGNQTHVHLNVNYLNSFALLPYYDFSTDKSFAELHGQHQFNGYLLRKIPLLNKLQFKMVIGAKALFTQENKPYSEYSIGLDNIGIGKIRFLRVDYVRSYSGGKSNDGILVGLSF